MTDRNRDQHAPDFEERHRLALAVLAYLGVDVEHVLIDSLTITLGPDRGHLVRWTGETRLPTDELTGILMQLKANPTRHHPG